MPQVTQELSKFAFRPLFQPAASAADAQVQLKFG
jgi:hypothetical protein